MGAAGGLPPRPGPPVTDKSMIRANFCGHLDQEGRIVFDPVYFCSIYITEAARRACYAVKRRMGLNAIVLQVPDGNAYGGYWTEPVAEWPDIPVHARTPHVIPDWRQQMDVFKALVDEVLSEGFLPLVFLTTGNDLETLGLHDGELRRKAKVFAGYGKKAWFSGGWEMTGSQTPTITTRQVNDMLRILHEELGDGALLFVHGADWERCTAASYRGNDPNNRPPGCVWMNGTWVEADDPSRGGEIDWWYTPEALWCLAWFWQSRHGGAGPSFNDDQELRGWRARAIECQIRFLARNKRPPAMDVTEPGAPDWMQSRDHVRPIFCVFELEPYEYIRALCDSARVQHVADLLHADGFLHLGSGT